MSSSKSSAAYPSARPAFPTSSFYTPGLQSNKTTDDTLPALLSPSGLPPARAPTSPSRPSVHPKGQVFPPIIALPSLPPTDAIPPQLRRIVPHGLAVRFRSNDRPGSWSERSDSHDGGYGKIVEQCRANGGHYRDVAIKGVAETASWRRIHQSGQENASGEKKGIKGMESRRQRHHPRIRA